MTGLGAPAGQGGGAADGAPGDAVVVGADGLARCPWPGLEHLDYRDYHDHEWGRPVHGEQALMERLSLEVFQSGLSWLTILRKRAAFRTAFAGFDPDVVAGFGPDEVQALLADPAIVRNRRKIVATIGNARATLALREHGGLDALVWSARPQRRRRPQRLCEVAAHTEESADLARALKQAGFAHLGPTTVYAAMQAVGVVQDHLAGCFRVADDSSAGVGGAP